MELKVWVDGILRVVCGLSEDTTCQEVVIALAQAIGQTGRYVLVQKLRDTERQLLADERPLQTLAKLGQLGTEVRFILRRTGPTSTGGGGSSNSSSRGGSSSSTGSIGSNGGGPPRPPDRTTSLAPLPPLPKHLHSEVPKRREPKKALTFNLGPSTGPHTQPKHFKKPQRDSPELRRPSPAPSPSPSPSPAHSPSPSPIPTPPASSSSTTTPGPSKEELFRQILQQQAELSALGEKLDAAQQEVWVLEQPPPPLLPPDLLEELDHLEEAVRRNKAELAHSAHWEEELQAEQEREDAMQQEVEQLRLQLEEHAQRLSDCGGQAGRLEHQLQEMQLEAQRNGLKQAQIAQESLDAAQAELDRRQRQEAELTSSLGDTEQELDMADRMLQEKTQELDDLNKELRQCNLQQFIQQTGAPPSMASQQDDLLGETELIEVSQLLMDTDTDSATSEDSGLFSSGSQPTLTARQILGNARSTKKPLVLTSRDLPWR